MHAAELIIVCPRTRELLAVDDEIQAATIRPRCAADPNKPTPVVIAPRDSELGATQAKFLSYDRFAKAERRARTGALSRGGDDVALVNNCPVADMIAAFVPELRSRGTAPTAPASI